MIKPRTSGYVFRELRQYLNSTNISKLYLTHLDKTVSIDGIGAKLSFQVESIAERKRLIKF